MKVTEIIRERCECASFCSLSGVVRQIPLFRGVDFLGGGAKDLENRKATMGRDRQITRHHGAASTSGVSHSTLLPVWSSCAGGRSPPVAAMPTPPAPRSHWSEATATKLSVCDAATPKPGRVESKIFLPRHLRAPPWA